MKKNSSMGKGRKSADYGTQKQAKSFGQVSNPKSNNQCKKAGTYDAREVQHK